MLDQLKAFITSLTVDRLLPAVVLIVVGVLAIRCIRALTDRALNKSKLERAAHSMIKSLLTVVLYLLLGLMVMARLGIDVTGAIALASVASLAISLALQDALANVIGGFSLLTTRPFKAGDYVEAAGHAGVVINVDMIYTHLRTPDGKLVSVPNSTMSASQILNYSATGQRRVEIIVSASYDAPMDQVLAALRRAAMVETALEDPAVFAAVQNFGDSAIEYVLHVWTTPEDFWDTTFMVKQRIKEEFDAANIEMTYPHLNVHLDR